MQTVSLTFFCENVAADIRPFGRVVQCVSPFQDISKCAIDVDEKEFKSINMNEINGSSWRICEIRLVDFNINTCWQLFLTD